MPRVYCIGHAQSILRYVPGYAQSILGYVPGYTYTMLGYVSRYAQSILGYVPGYVEGIYPANHTLDKFLRRTPVPGMFFSCCAVDR